MLTRSISRKRKQLQNEYDAAKKAKAQSLSKLSEDTATLVRCEHRMKLNHIVHELLQTGKYMAVLWNQQLAKIAQEEPALISAAKLRKIRFPHIPVYCGWQSDDEHEEEVMKWQVQTPIRHHIVQRLFYFLDDKRRNLRYAGSLLNGLHRRAELLDVGESSVRGISADVSEYGHKFHELAKSNYEHDHRGFFSYLVRKYSHNQLFPDLARVVAEYIPAPPIDYVTTLEVYCLTRTHI